MEDIAITRAIADMTVVSACDGNAIRSLIRSTVDVPGPVYLRIGRGVEKSVYTDLQAFEPGRFRTLRPGTDATVIACGVAVRNALDAAEAMAGQGISVGVLDAVYLKPIDREAICRAARDTRAILTVEEHNPSGGLGGAVAEILAENGFGLRFARHSLPDGYALVAPPSHLYRHYGLDQPGIVRALQSLLLGRPDAGAGQ